MESLLKGGLNVILPPSKGPCSTPSLGVSLVTPSPLERQFPCVQFFNLIDQVLKRVGR